MNFKQALLENAIGTAARAARELGDDPRAIEVWRAAALLKAQRDPEVVARLEAKRLRRVQAQAARVAA